MLSRVPTAWSRAVVAGLLGLSGCTMKHRRTWSRWLLRRMSNPHRAGRTLIQPDQTRGLATLFPLTMMALEGSSQSPHADTLDASPACSRTLHGLSIENLRVPRNRHHSGSCRSRRVFDGLRKLDAFKPFDRDCFASIHLDLIYEARIHG